MVVASAGTLAGHIKKGAYFDSVTLMTIGRHVQGLPGVLDAAVVMGTPENRAILAASGLLLPEFEQARDTDLLIALKLAEAGRVETVLAEIDQQFQLARSRKTQGAEARPRSLDGALEVLPGANLALISVAGRYAADEARAALERGLHVMLFSDNVPIDQEIALKQLAAERGLLVMGPDCGTAIVNGVPLGFANVVPRGAIGVVAAAGTGLQEVTTLIARGGGGISQALGTGGRDIKAKVGGVSFATALEALADDPHTEVILLIAKPPDPLVAERLSAIVKNVTKPVVTLFLGDRGGAEAGPATLEEAALAALALWRGADLATGLAGLPGRGQDQLAEAERMAARLPASRRYLRGLFSGGTFCAEAQVILAQDTIAAGRGFPLLAPLFSNAPTGATARLDSALVSLAHTVVDLGEDEFTQGRPHPMIDYSLRLRRLAAEAADPEVAVVLLDVVLGYGSHEDPASELAPAIAAARDRVAVVCSVTGTEADPQSRSRTVRQLEAAGAVVAPSNAAACHLAGWIARLQEDRHLGNTEPPAIVHPQENRP